MNGKVASLLVIAAALGAGSGMPEPTYRPDERTDFQKWSDEMKTLLKPRLFYSSRIPYVRPKRQIAGSTLT